MAMPRSIASALVLCALAGCGGGGDGADVETAAVVRDSVGVQIVENARPRWTERTALEVAAEPRVSIGEVDGPAEYQLYQVRAATRLGDGTIAVFDGGSQELRFYDSTGTFVRRVGGKGGGPGEYQRVTWVRRLAGDSLMLNDSQAKRITVLAPDGTVERSVNTAAIAPPAAPTEVAGSGGARVRVGGGRYEILTPLADGALLARIARDGRPAESGAPVARDSLTYVRLAADGRLRDTLGVFIGDESQATIGGGPGNRLVMIGTPPFGRTSRVAVDSRGFWFGASDRYELAHHTADGQVDRIIRRSLEPIAVTPAVAKSAEEAEIAQQTTGPADMLELLHQLTEEKWAKAVLPATLPAHGELLTGNDGLLWVAETNLPDETIPRWTAFDTDGRMLGTVSMPARLRVLEFGDDYVLGVSTDEMGVEQVRLYMLHTGSGR